LSEQIDIIVYDRHFTPFIFKGESTVYIPAEGVYAVFEVKPELNKKTHDYAVEKLESVTRLKRTSAEFRHIMGVDKQQLFPIMGGLLSKRNGSGSVYDSFNADSLLSVLVCLDKGAKVVKTIKCDKVWTRQEADVSVGKPVLAFFLLKLIESLRGVGSVPALKVDEYLNNCITPERRD